MSGLSALIGALRVNLGFDTAEFEEGAKRSKSTARKNATDIQSIYHEAGEKIGRTLRSALTITGAALGVTAIASAAKSALDYASSLGEVAQQLGVTTRDLQVYRFVASQVGIDQGTMDAGLAKLTRSIGLAARGSKEQASAFRELGVSVTDANGHVLTGGEVLLRLADGFAKVKDASARSTPEVVLFGKSGQQLDPLLAGGSGAIREMAAEFERLGGVLSDDAIARADDTADKLSKLQQVLQAHIATAVTANVDSITSLIDVLTVLVVKAGEAATAWKRYRLEIGATRYEQAANSPLGTEGQRDRARTNLNAVRGELLSMDAKPGTWHFDMRTGRFVQGGAARPAPPSSGALPTVNDNGAGARAAAQAAAKARRESQKASERELTSRAQLAQSMSERLGYEQQLTSDAQYQADFEHQRIAIEAEQRRSEIERSVISGQITAAAGEELKRQLDRNTELQQSIVNRQLDEKLAQDALNLRLSEIDNQREMLGLQSDLARTAGERRAIELRLLDLQGQEEKARLEAILASRQSTDAEKQIAQSRLNELPVLQAARGEAVRRQNADPMQAYLDSLPHGIEGVREQIEQLKVDKIRSLTDSFGEMAQNVLGVHGALGEIIGDIAKIILQQAQLAFAPGGGGFSGFLSALGGGSGLGALFHGGGDFAALGTSSAGSLVPPGGFDMTLPGFAGGGTVRGFPGIDRNVLSLNGRGFARVAHGEQLRIEPNNDNRRSGGGGNVFDLRGAVMTQDLLDQMNHLAVNGAVAVVADNNMRTSRGRRRLLPGAR